jgi:ATP-dependent exoDNAse (exonuclease V) beta subunit
MNSKATTDARARRLASGLDGGLAHTYLIEAGAGTGKTSVLVDRFLALVRTGVRITRIVAITFTEKAAGELRIRLRSGLEEALVAGCDESEAGATRSRHAEGDENAGALTAEERERFRTALHEIDRAQVSTIHGFCTGLLKERPVEAAVDPNFGVADALRQTVLLNEAWEEWLQKELTGRPPDSVGQSQALGLTLSGIRDLAFMLIENRDVIELVPDPVTPPDTGAFLSELATTARAFLNLSERHCKDPDDKGAVAIRAFARQVDELGMLPEEARAVHALKHVKLFPKSGKGRKDNWEDDVLATLRARSADLAEKRDELQEDISHNTAVELLDWLAGFIAAYEAKKRSSGVLDFQDLLTRARDLIRDNTEVRSHFKEAFDRILVDEFQDTDPLQCEIAFFLAEKKGTPARDWRKIELEPGKLFIVGDPKQSIYRFRRADIETYEQAKEIVRAAGEVLELAENFRTRPAIIEGVNTVFSDIMKPPDDGRRYQPDYAPLVPHRPPDTAGAGVVVLGPASPDGEKPLADEIRALEAAAVAAFIEQLPASGELVYSRDTEQWRAPELRDIAILFRTMTALDAYEDALSNYGIEYRILGGKKFYIRREVQELATVLTAIEDPHNAAAIVGALRTPFFGVSDDAIVLQKWQTGALSYLSPSADGVAEVEEAFALLRELNAVRNADGIVRVILRLFDQTSALELFLLKPSGEQRHANLLKVVELATSMERDELMSFGGFVRWLRDISQLTPEEAESPLSEEGDNFVRLLTVHKAKGLEFPITVLADLGRFKDRSEKVVIDRGTGCIDLGIGRKDDKFCTRGFAAASKLEKLRREAELIRLLYVGATRARDLLVVPWFTKEGDDSGLLTKLSALREMAGAPVGAISAIAGDPAVVSYDIAELDLTRVRRSEVRLDLDAAKGINYEKTEAFLEKERWRDWLAGYAGKHHFPLRTVTPSSLEYVSGAALLPVAPALADTPDRFSGRAFGTLVHRVLERIDLRSPVDVAVEARALAMMEGIDKDEAEAAAALVEHAMGSDVMIRAGNADLVLKEVPLCLPHGDGFLEGSLDLVFEEDGELIVVDYKTNLLGPGGLDALEKHYMPQALTYGLALTKILRRPVKEVILLFVRGGENGEPAERSIPMGIDAISAARKLDTRLGKLLP